jgi:nucleoside-diphosphate-sugar epimerase
LKEKRLLNREKILITGGAGYVGSRLINICLNAGYKVKCYDMLIYGDQSIKKFKRNENFELFQSNLCDTSSLKKAIEDIDYVVHLAAIVGDQPCQVAPKSAYKINYLATKNLLDIACEKKVKKFIFSSTCSNYGVSNENHFANEESKLNPVSLYAETKIDCEKYITTLDSSALDCITLRFATAYGVSERTRFDLTINSFTYEAIKNKNLFVFAANTWRPYIHVNDMCNFILKFIKTKNLKNKSNSEKIFNVGFNNQNYTKKNLLDKIIKYVPDTKIQFVDDIIDNRNYKVSFEKLNNFFSDKPEINVDKGIIELKKLINENKNIDEIFNNSNLDALKKFFKNNEGNLLK